MTFDQLGLNDTVLESISYMGFNEATPIQEQAIPLILEGRDLIACAQTGTGKTAAFMLPTLSKLSEKTEKKGLKTLVIVPTRELAVQVEQQVQGFSYFAPISSHTVYGGGDANDWIFQKKALTGDTDVIVATPGKLLSHLNMGYVDFSELETLILDEADRMLDMGFFDDIMTIISHLPKKRQTLLFSATMPPKIRQMAKDILVNPGEITIALSKPAEGVLQACYELPERSKVPLIRQLIEDKPEYKSIVIFSSTKKKVGDIFRGLKKKADYEVGWISSDLEQKEREEVMMAFKSRRTRVIVATDVISRGIDINDINLVINFDVPDDAEDYVHRVGRTARADTTGVAITLITKADKYKFDRIEELIEKKIMRVPLPEEFQGVDDSRPRDGHRGGGGGGRGKGNFRGKGGGGGRGKGGYRGKGGGGRGKDGGGGGQSRKPRN